MSLVRRLQELFPGHRYRDRVSRRVSKMTQADMVEWADQGVTQLSRSVAALRNGADPQELEATTDGLVVVTVVLEELVRRR